MSEKRRPNLLPRGRRRHITDLRHIASFGLQVARSSGQLILDRSFTHFLTLRSRTGAGAEVVRRAERNAPQSTKLTSVGVRFAHWCTIFLSVILDGLLVHPWCRWPTASFRSTEQFRSTMSAAGAGGDQGARTVDRAERRERRTVSEPGVAS
jgi:hypothetical protein